MTQEAYSGELCGCMLDDHFCEWPGCQLAKPNIHDVPYYVWSPNLSYGAKGVYPNRPKKDYRRDWRVR